MILNKYFFLGTFLFFILLFSVIIFWDSKNESGSATEKEIVWIEKPSFMLLKDLKSKNPVLRREAIQKLGEKRVKNAIQPLFEIMFSNYPLHEKQLAAKSVAMITEGEIIPICLKILDEYKNDPTNEIVLSMISILKHFDTTGKDLSKYDFSILETILNQSKENTLIISIIEAIENLKYAKSFTILKDLYGKNFFYKINVLKAMTQLALEKPEIADWMKGFLAKVIWEESHDDIKKTIRESFFTLNFKHKPDSAESALITSISDLSSSSFKKVFDAENQLIEAEFDEKAMAVVRYFIKDLDPVVTNRLISILSDKNIPELRETFIEIIQNRYGSSKNREASLDSARKALKGLARITKTGEDINYIGGYLQDPVLNDIALESLQILLERKFDKDAIDKKISALSYYSISSNQRSYFLPYLKISLLLNGIPRIEKLIQSGDSYVRYNVLNILLEFTNGLLPNNLEWIKKTGDEIVISILKRYKAI